MSMKNARFVKFDTKTMDTAKDIVIRKLTDKEKDALLERIMSKMSEDTLSDLIAEIAAESTNGQADTILWD